MSNKTTERKPILTVGIKDLEIQTFCTGGKGGQNQNRRQMGVRLIHHPSGARAEAREERHQEANKRRAFERLAQSEKLQQWLRIESARRIGKPVPETPEQIRERVNRIVDEGLRDGTVLVEEIEVEVA